MEVPRVNDAVGMCGLGWILSCEEGEPMSFEKTFDDPGLTFKRPAQVLQSNDLSWEQKIKILRQWEYDVRELQVAEEESMSGGPEPVTLAEVREALRTLGVVGDPDSSGPTKQGGGI
jgi:hypothetical protein